MQEDKITKTVRISNLDYKTNHAMHLNLYENQEGSRDEEEENQVQIVGTKRKRRMSGQEQAGWGGGGGSDTKRKRRMSRKEQTRWGGGGGEPGSDSWYKEEEKGE